MFCRNNDEQMLEMRKRLYAPSMVEMVLRYAETQPEKSCVADPDEEMTYGAFGRRIREKAEALADQVKKGTRVLARARQRGDFLALHLAVHLLGGIFIPVSQETPPAKLQELSGLLGAGVVLDPSRVDGKPAHSRFTFPEPEEKATILYTTGTTGRSKGIVLTHTAEVAVAQNVFYGTQMEEDAVELIPLPVSHSYALRHCFGLLLGGRSIVLCDGVSLPGDLFALMDRYGVNALSLTPASVNVLLRFAERELSERAPRIRYLQLGTAGVDGVLKDRMRTLFPNARLYQYYSSTEAGCACLFDYRSDRSPRRVGKPAVNARFEIMDRDGQILKSGPDVWGYIACRGPMNMLCYDGDPELTRRTVRDGYVVSQDIGYLDGDGYLCFVGRDGEVINTGGYKVAPEEVEEAAMQSGMLHECACTAEEDALLGQVPVLFAVVKDPEHFSAAQLTAYLREKLEAYKVPRRIARMEAIPRNALGKIQRRACLEKEREGRK